MLLLVCGKPGTGKTYTCQSIECLVNTTTKCAAVAFMWSAVFEMKVKCSKSSIHILLAASPRNLTADTLAKGVWPKKEDVFDFREKYMETGVFFVDEVSTMNPVLFAGLERMIPLHQFPFQFRNQSLHQVEHQLLRHIFAQV